MGTLGQLNSAHFARLIQRYGEPVVRYLQYVGPCPNTHNNSLMGFRPDNTCTVCGGTGEIYRDLDTAIIARQSQAGGRVVMQNALESKKRQPVIIAGDQAQCSYLPDDYPMAEGDRLLFASREGYRSQVFVYDEKADGTTTLFPAYWPLLEIEAVYDAAGVVAGGNYTIAANEREITFSGGVTAGDQLTVLYRYREQWVVVPNGKLDRVAATNGDRFPNRCVLVKWQRMDTDMQAAQLDGTL